DRLLKAPLMQKNLNGSTHDLGSYILHRLVDDLQLLDQLLLNYRTILQMIDDQSQIAAILAKEVSWKICSLGRPCSTLVAKAPVPKERHPAKRCSNGCQLRIEIPLLPVRKNRLLRTNILGIEVASEPLLASRNQHLDRSLPLLEQIVGGACFR